jgi:hypothetical protein
MVKNIIHLLVVSFSILPISCIRTNDELISRLDPGRYDETWWNRAPIRLIQTNLPEIEAGMDVGAYVQSIEDASANSVLINVGGIVANYPTTLPDHYKNPYLKGDLIGELIHELHQKDIRVFGRFDFSKVNAEIAARHQQWLYVGLDGGNVNYNGQVHTCINGAYQQEYAFKILSEAIPAYPLDGIFFNMIGYQTHDYSGVNHGICQCTNCKTRFQDSTGFSLPRVLVPDDPVAVAYRAFQKSTSEDLFNRIGRHIRRLDPSIAVNTYTDAGVDLIASESSSSLSSGYEWNYSGTANVKPILGSYADRAPCNLLIYFQAIQYRHIGTSPNTARTWMLQNMLNGAPVTFVVIGTLPEYPDRVFFPVLKDLYRFHENHEKLFTNLQSINSIALVKGSGPEYQGLVRLLSEEHVNFDVLEPASLGSNRSPRLPGGYELLILGDVNYLPDTTLIMLDQFVHNGGKILATGFTSINDPQTGRVGLKSLGILPGSELLSRAPSTYLSVSDEDKLALGPGFFRHFSLMMMHSDFIKCRPAGSAAGYFRLVPNTRFGPPEKCYFTEEQITDFPGLIVNRSGKGITAFIPWRLGELYNFKGNYAHRALFAACLKEVLKVDGYLETDAPPQIEISHMGNRDGAFEWIGLINHPVQIGASFHEPVPVYNIPIRFKPQKPVRELRSIRSEGKLKFSRRGEWVEFIIPSVKDFEMVLCLYR